MMKCLELYFKNLIIYESRQLEIMSHVETHKIYTNCLIAKSKMATADVRTNISISATTHPSYDLYMFIYVSKTMKWFKV